MPISLLTSSDPSFHLFPGLFVRIKSLDSSFYIDVFALRIIPTHSSFKYDQTWLQQINTPSILSKGEIFPSKPAGSKLYLADTKEETDESKHFSLTAANHTDFQAALEQVTHNLVGEKLSQPFLFPTMQPMTQSILGIYSLALTQSHLNLFNSMQLGFGELLIMMPWALTIRIVLQSTQGQWILIITQSNFAFGPRWWPSGFKGTLIAQVGNAQGSNWWFPGAWVICAMKNHLYLMI